MKIDEAYAIELGRNVDIYTAQTEFFAQGEPRRRFRFECSDEACRLALHPTVTGVLYDRPITEADLTSRIQFNWGPLSQHLETCPWQELREALAMRHQNGRQGGPPDSNRRITFSSLDQTEVPDVLLVDQDDIDFERGRKKRDRGRIRNLKDRPARIQEYVRQANEDLEKTSQLGEVVNAFRWMTSEERRSAKLTVRGIGRMSYAAFFRNVGWPVHEDRRIYLGGAKFSPAKGGIRLSFYDKTLINGIETPVSLYIRDKDLEGKPSLSLLRSQLAALASGRFDYAIVYFLGRISLSSQIFDNGPRADARPMSLSHVVLILRSKGQK